MKLKIQQFMMRYLRKRSWIVFYLDKEIECKDQCWLKLYRDELKRKEN